MSDFPGAHREQVIEPVVDFPEPQDSHHSQGRLVDPVWVWGVPFAAFTMSDAVSAVEKLIEAGRPELLHHGPRTLCHAVPGQPGSQTD